VEVILLLIFKIAKKNIDSFLFVKMNYLMRILSFFQIKFFIFLIKAMGFVMAMFMNAMDYKEFDYAKNSMM
jgi:hypothetical protein